MSFAHLSLVALFACSSHSPRDPPANRGGAPLELQLEYRTWGLMPPPRCGGASYEILIARDRSVKCGWHSECPPYSAAAPLQPKPAHRLDDAHTSRLVELASSAEFEALPPFSSNIHIIDGGAEQIHVVLGARDQTVEMANTGAPAFTALRDAVQAATGCSLATSGPEPR